MVTAYKSATTFRLWTTNVRMDPHLRKSNRKSLSDSRSSAPCGTILLAWSVATDQWETWSVCKWNTFLSTNWTPPEAKLKGQTRKTWLSLRRSIHSGWKGSPIGLPAWAFSVAPKVLRAGPAIFHLFPSVVSHISETNLFCPAKIFSNDWTIQTKIWSPDERLDSRSWSVSNCALLGSLELRPMKFQTFRSAFCSLQTGLVCVDRDLDPDKSSNVSLVLLWIWTLDSRIKILDFQPASLHANLHIPWILDKLQIQKTCQESGSGSSGSGSTHLQKPVAHVEEKQPVLQHISVDAQGCLRAHIEAFLTHGWENRRPCTVRKTLYRCLGSTGRLQNLGLFYIIRSFCSNAIALWRHRRRYVADPHVSHSNSWRKRKQELFSKNFAAR